MHVDQVCVLMTALCALLGALGLFDMVVYSDVCVVGCIIVGTVVYIIVRLLYGFDYLTNLLLDY